MANKKNDSLDACPFPPDGEPLGKTLATNMLETMDWLFDNWRNTLLLMSLISMVLVYSLFMTPLTLITLSTTPNTWNQEFSLDFPDERDDYTWLYDPAPDTTESTNIILEENETYEIINQTVHLNGYILLKDTSKLILRNSQLAINPTRVKVNGEKYHNYAHILLMNSSQIILDNSVIITQEGSLMIGAIDEAQLVLKSSFIIDGTVWFDDSTNLDAQDSYIEHLSINGDMQGTVSNSTFVSITYENRRRAGLINPRNHGDASLLLQGCSIDSLELDFFGGSLTIDKPVTGHSESWNPYVDWDASGYVFNVTLVDSEVRTIALFTIIDGSCTVIGVDDMIAVSGVNSSLKVFDSNIGAIGGYYSTLDMNNSVAYSVSFTEDSQIDREIGVSNSYVDSFARISCSNIQTLGLHGRVDVVFDQVKAEVVHVHDGDVFVEGDLVYDQDAPHRYEIQDFESVLFKQEYRVEALGESHMVPDVDLTVIDESGMVVWEGVSGVNGEAFFNITFCNYYPLYEPYEYVSNIDETWTLVASMGDEVVESEVRFRETGSPIVLQFSEPKVLQRMKFTSLSWASLGAIAVILVVKLLKKN